LAIVLYIIRFTTSDYTFGIFKLFIKCQLTKTTVRGYTLYPDTLSRFRANMLCSYSLMLLNTNFIIFGLTRPVLHTHFPPRKNEYILVFPPERSVYTHFPPGKISIYSSFPLIFRGGKSEYILKFPPHTQFSPFALIDYTRAITPIRGLLYGDFCRAFDAEEGRSPLFFSICTY
jgi:hypothetical protein